MQINAAVVTTRVRFVNVSVILGILGYLFKTMTDSFFHNLVLSLEIFIQKN